MRWFGRKQDPEHAVIVHFSLTGDEYGTEDEREALHRLTDSLEARIEANRAGEYDGDEFGGGEGVLYCYGPDADRLFSVIEADVRSFPARPAFAILRYGPADDRAAQERRIDL